MNKVLETLKKFGTDAKTKWTSLARKTRIITLAVAGVIIVSAIILTVILNQKRYAVLFSGTSSADSAEILNYVQNTMGVTDIILKDDGDILVPQEQVENIRVQCSMQGYPASGFNYDIWDTGVSMFSTESEKREKQKQQLQSNLMATIDSFSGVDSSMVILSIPENNNYVISTDEKHASASVVLHLRNESLPSDVIDGIYNLVKTSVPGLERDYITITDGTGKQLFADLGSDDTEIDPALEGSSLVQLYYKRLEYQQKLQNILKEELSGMFDGVYKKFNVGVNLILNYNDEVKESTEYTPSVDEEGNRGGMVSNETYEATSGGTALEGGVVGTTVDSDISPDYPTVTADAGDEFYYRSAKTINYLVNEEKTQIAKDGYSIENLSASVIVDGPTMTEAEVEAWQKMIASAIGAKPENVSFVSTTWSLENSNDIGGGTFVVNNNRNTLIFVIIALGALLIILLILALMTAGSKKRRNIKAQRQAIAQGMVSVQGGSSDSISMSGDGAVTGVETTGAVSGSQPFDPADLPSLNDQEANETREVVLKREIRDFSKNNPEIVAQLIRSWMKNEE